MRIHREWIQLALQAALAAGVVAVLTGVYLGHGDGVLAEVRQVSVRLPTLWHSTSEISFNAVQLTDMIPLTLAVGIVRRRLAGVCRPHPRVPLGGWMTANGVAVDNTGTCQAQSWCVDPLAATADGRIYCSLQQSGSRFQSALVGEMRWVSGPDGHDLMSHTTISGFDLVTSGRCAVVTAACTRRGRIELPCGPNTTLFLELWPPPDGSSAVGVVCSSCGQLGRQKNWNSVLRGGRVNTSSVVADPACTVTRVVYADTAYYEMPLSDAAAVLNQTFTMYEVSAVAIDESHIGIVIHRTPSLSTFCLRWFGTPLAMRGARVLAVNGFSVTPTPICSTMCASIPDGESFITLLLWTDALPSAFGPQIGLGPLIAGARVDLQSTGPLDSSLPQQYLRLTPHQLAVRVERQPVPTLIFDTNGTARALVPPDVLFPSIFLENWMPACPQKICHLVFATESSVAPSLCYVLPDSITLRAPVALSQQPTVTTYTPGTPLQTASKAPVALAPPNNYFFIVTTAPINSTTVMCGGAQYRVPTAMPPTHCMPTAGVTNVASISRFWLDSDAAVSPNSSLPGCSLVMFFSSFGVHLASEQCVPVAPNTTVELDGVSICSTGVLATVPAVDAASVEASRQLGLDPTQFPFLYASVE